jgi:CRP/FNR family cyclic AMP-dependent transcriptional regulator
MARAAQESSFVRLLDADPSLRAGISGDALALARELLVAPVLPLDEGWWKPPQPLRPTQHLGFLLLHGVLFRRVSFAERDSAELLGRGDLLRPWQPLRSASVPAAVASWTVIERGAVAVLDARVTGTVGRWPELVTTLVGRALERSRAMAVTLGIAQMPGLEPRLLALMWHLVERFGHRERDRWVIPIRLTHTMLAALARTQRPTLTSALGRLAEQGLVARLDDGAWAVRGEPPEGLTALRTAVGG